MAVAFELFDLGLEMFRTRLRRENPGVSDEQVEAAVCAWLEHRPGAEHGDAEGRPASWPRSTTISSR
jgi:hypothetical protein